MVQVLVAGNADTNAKDTKRGKTALHYASSGSSYNAQIVTVRVWRWRRVARTRSERARACEQLLLESKADPTLKDHKGNVALCKRFVADQESAAAGDGEVGPPRREPVLAPAQRVRVCAGRV